MRARVGELAAPTQAPFDPRVALLVDLARLHVTAISQDAGSALAHYEATIAMKLDELEPIWRAEAPYALAAWADLWAFTNELEDLDRTGAPNDDAQTLLARFAKAREALPKNEVRPSWVSCAVVNTEAAVHLKLCGREADCQASEKLQEAEQCYEKRDDQVGARGARYNRAVYLMATGGSVEIDYGVQGEVIQAVAAKTRYRIKFRVDLAHRLKPGDFPFDWRVT